MEIRFHLHLFGCDQMEFLQVSTFTQTNGKDRIETFLTKIVGLIIFFNIHP